MSFTPGIEIPNEVAAAKVHAHMYEPEDGYWQIIAAAHQKRGVISGCAVTAQSVPNMTVAVASGKILDGVTERAVTGGNVTIQAADATNPRWDLVCINSTNGALVNPIVSDGKGTAAANPQFPNIRALTDRIVIAAVYVPASDTTIENNQINDTRVFVVTPKRACIRTDASVADTGTAFIVDFAGGSVLFDNDSMANIANDRIDINTAGIYHIWGQVLWAGTAGTTELRLQIRVNGVNVSQMSSHYGSSGTGYMQEASTVVKLVAGDYVTLWCDSVSISLGLATNSTMGHRLGAAQIGYTE